MQHRAQVHEDDESFVVKETEVVYCNDIPSLFERLKTNV